MTHQSTRKSGSRGAPPRIALLLTGFLIASAAPAAAAGFDATWGAAGHDGFSRHYDRKHLASHPRQRLTSFTVAPTPSEAELAPGSFEITFSFTLKGDRDVYESGATCHHTAAGVECWVECDGGSFTMQADGKGLLLRIARMEVEGERDFSPDLAGGDDRVVRLFPTKRAGLTH